MNRRAHRPNESHHRDARRKGLDRLAMLEAKTNPPRTSWIQRLIARLLRK
jgi:hypothetical protein